MNAAVFAVVGSNCCCACCNDGIPKAVVACALSNPALALCINGSKDATPVLCPVAGSIPKAL